MGKTKQDERKRNTSSHLAYVRRVTFRSQGSKALRAYNQYYIFHCHLHSYCKWLVSKIITGCIRNLGFAISLLVLGGPVCSPSLTLAPLGVNDAMVADTSHTIADFFPLCPFFILLLLTVLWTAGKMCVCVRKRPEVETISPLCKFWCSASCMPLIGGLEKSQICCYLQWHVTLGSNRQDEKLCSRMIDFVTKIKFFCWERRFKKSRLPYLI